MLIIFMLAFMAISSECFYEDEKNENEISQINNEITTSTRNPSPVPVQTEPSQNNNLEKAMFKPKSQIITSNIKLPKI